MPTVAKEEIVTLRLTKPEKQELQNTANLAGQSPSFLASNFVREGVRRTRFPVIEFRDGEPGRVAYLAGTRWPVWMIVQLFKECDGKIDEVAEHLHRPAALVKMALKYGAAYPNEIAACLALNEARDFEGLRREIPHLEKL
jgi:hypothetical protein